MGKLIRFIPKLAALLYISWLLKMLVHEAGHVLGALTSGGHVVRVVWGPFSLSRTDVSPNPNPRFETWSGPIFGAIVPALIAFTFRKKRPAKLLTFFAGFCLIANGAYLAVGALSPAGDARDLLHLGTPRWLLVAIGAPLFATGLWLWHRLTIKSPCDFVTANQVDPV